MIYTELECLEEFENKPSVSYVEVEDKKYIAVLIDDVRDQYIIYPVKDKDEWTDWPEFKKTHTALTRANGSQFNWKLTNRRTHVFSNQYERSIE
ncbi:MAG: hypothetical protein ACP5N7_00105 [Candidatus Pacearchaeota archaeon]